MGEATLTAPRQRRTELWQPRQPVFWVTAALLLVCGWLVLGEGTRNVSSAGGLVAALIFAAVQVVIFWVVAWALPRFRRQPRGLQLAAALWGGVVTIGVAMFANSIGAAALWPFGIESLRASLTAPINEDVMRLLGVLAVLTLASRRCLTVMDGVVYGFLVGAGMEITENLFFALRGDDLGATLSSGVTRLLIGFGLHALWTAAAGAGLAYCLSRRQQGFGGRWWVLIPLVLAPMVLHAAWDSPSPSVFEVLKFVVFVPTYAVTLALFFAVVAWGRRSEFAWYLDTVGAGAESSAEAEGGARFDRRTFGKLPRAERHRLAADAVRLERSRD